MARNVHINLGGENTICFQCGILGCFSFQMWNDGMNCNMQRIQWWWYC